MRTLLIDGYWNLKRNYHKLRDPQHMMYECGGTLGFLNSLRATINKVIPDRVVVMWDGRFSGKFRHDIYPPYKSKRKKEWDLQSEIELKGQNLNLNDYNRDTYSLSNQKIILQEILEELSIRQCEVEFIEADDLIASYCIQADPTEQIFINARDKDYRQIVSENVSIITPDDLRIITFQNFKQIIGHTIENELFLKCFIGDGSDCVKGVNGITENKLIKYFPAIKDEKYTYKRLVAETKEMASKKKLVFFDKILECEETIYLNARLMNLKKPFLTQNAIDEVKFIQTAPLGLDRNVKAVFEIFSKHRYNELLQVDVNYYLSPFNIIVQKEREYYNSKVLKK